jgi:hypothetical protein
MAFRPNYRAERAQKSRAKDEKKQEKLKRLEEASAKRKALREGEPGDDPAGSDLPAAGEPSERLRE